MVGEQDHEDNEEFAFVTLCQQVSDVGIETSSDELDKDIVDWEARVSGDIKDIFDCDSDYLEVSTTSWTKVSSWDDAKWESNEDDSIGISSYSTNDSDNRFMALCCWHNEDEESEELDEVNDLEPEVEISEIEKHQEVDNVMSYEEQVKQERQLYDVHESFYRKENNMSRGKTQGQGDSDEPVNDRERTCDVNDAVSAGQRVSTALWTSREYPEMEPRLVDVSDAYIQASLGSDSEDDSDMEEDGDSDDPSDDRRTAIEECEPEEEMAAAEADDDVTDNAYPTSTE